MSVSRRQFVQTLFGGALVATQATRGGARPALPLDDPTDERFWTDLRKEFLIPEGEVFCNTATLGSMPKRVLDVVVSGMTDVEKTLAHWDYRPEHPPWFAGYDPFLETRTPLAEFVGCSVDELALCQNATMGMNFVANGIDLSPGDEVLQTDQEHPGGKCGWELKAKRTGAVWKSVALPRPPNDPDEVVNRFAAAITRKTRVLAIPHQTSMLGIVMPVERLTALAREKGHPDIFVALDGAQTVGQIEVDIPRTGCDAYFFSPHKWLLAPPGTGGLYVRKSRQHELWTTLASTEWADNEKGAFRFMQYGTGNRSLLDGLREAVRFRQDLGQARVARRIRALGDRLRRGLQSIDGVSIHSSIHETMAAGITTYAVRGHTGPEVMDRFWEHRYRVRSMGDTEGVRHSLHIYNSIDDVERGLEIARQLARG
jgi:selenocysteine lyase/cysteine desulfurase